MSARPILYFIRHGETDWNRDGRLQGQRDVPLNDLGRAQAVEAAERLRRIRPDAVALDFVASPLGRTRETMERVRATLGLPPHGYRLDARWRELTFGIWEGLTWKEARRADPLLAKARERDKWSAIPPEGESYAMLLDRLLPALDELTRDTVLVSHGGVARVLLVELAGVSKREAPNVDVTQGRVLVLERGRSAWR